LVHFNCLGDVENLNETIDDSKMVRSESIASIESIEIDRPLDEIVGTGDVSKEETEIEVKADEEIKEIEKEEIKTETEPEEDQMEVSINKEPEEEPAAEVKKCFFEIFFFFFFEIF